MIVAQAKDIAGAWVIEEASGISGFGGAFFHGSITWLPEDADLPATSDLDVIVVLDDPGLPYKPGKIRYRDLTIDVSYLPSDQLRSPEQVLGQSHLAGSLRVPSVIADPDRRLTDLQVAVARDFAKRHWVVRRCEHARKKVLGSLASLRETAQFHEQVIPWLFATGVTTHVLLVAGLQNPTVRRRYVAVRQLLVDHGRAEFYEPLLELLGCAHMTQERAESHLARLAEAFDAAKTAIKSPFPFASDISDLARPIAIDGSWELIERGDHREAVFWLAVTYARCQQVLDRDAPPGMRETFDPGFRRLLDDLGIISFADLQRRAEEVRAALPRIWAVAEAIITANPEMED